MAEPESILTSTKAALGIPEGHTAFDVELTIFVNSVLSRLTQLGVGPKDGFRIDDKIATWEDFMGTSPKLNMVKSYMFLRIKLLFDPPDVGFVLTAMKEQIEKDEWLIMVECDPAEKPPVVEIVMADAFGEPTIIPVTVVAPSMDGATLDGGGL